MESDPRPLSTKRRIGLALTIAVISTSLILPNLYFPLWEGMVIIVGVSIFFSGLLALLLGKGGAKISLPFTSLFFLALAFTGASISVFFHLPFGKALLAFVCLTIVGTIVLLIGNILVFYFLRRDPEWGEHLTEESENGKAEA